jgi:hypothetical protein
MTTKITYKDFASDFYQTYGTSTYTITGITYQYGWSLCPLNMATTATLNGRGFDSGSVVSINGSSVSTTYVSSTQLTFAAPSLSTAGFKTLSVTRSDGMTLPYSPGILFGSPPAPVGAGEQVYTTPGTYSWIAPAGVTSVNVVAVGGGGAGSESGGYGPDGADSYFINATTVKGGGGQGSRSSGYGTPGSYVGDGGGTGGTPYTVNSFSEGGGGAGGYTGNGGTGSGYYGTGMTAGTGGAGGGGKVHMASQVGGGGGGTGLYGQGADGAAGSADGEGGFGGSGGGNGVTATGTIMGDGGYPGGAGGGGKINPGWAGGSGAGLGWKNNITVVPGNSYTVVVGSGGTGVTNAGKGAHGGVRIIWGTNRFFPSINTGII